MPTPISYAIGMVSARIARLVAIGERRRSMTRVAAIAAMVRAHHTYAPRSGGSSASGRKTTAMSGGESSGEVQYGGLSSTGRSPGESA